MILWEKLIANNTISEDGSQSRFMRQKSMISIRRLFALIHMLSILYRPLLFVTTLEECAKRLSMRFFVWKTIDDLLYQNSHILFTTTQKPRLQHFHISVSIKNDSIRYRYNVNVAELPVGTVFRIVNYVSSGQHVYCASVTWNRGTPLSVMDNQYSR